jgi:hypothetical protein
MSRRRPPVVREAIATLGERGHAADVDLDGTHFKIRVADGRKHLLVVSRTPSGRRASAKQALVREMAEG